MYSEKDVLTRAWLVREIVNSVLCKEMLTVDKIFVCGSYANGTATAFSDLDFIVQLKGGKQIGKLFPTWDQIEEINKKIDAPKIHVIFGTEAAAESLHQKHKHEKKDYSYKLLPLQELDNVSNSRSTSLTQ